MLLQCIELIVGIFHEVLLNNNSMTEIRRIVSFAERDSCLTIPSDYAQIAAGQTLAITYARVFQ